MNNESTSIEIAKPKSIWGRSVKLDIKPFFLALGKGIVHAATLKVDDVGIDIVEAVASLGLDTPVSELAFVLVKRSTSKALISLTRESLSHIDPKSLESKELTDECLNLLDGLTITFGKDFIRRPSEEIFVKDIAAIYERWLLDNGVSISSAKSISSRIPAYFTFALATEWRSNAAKYKPLILEDGSPFASAEAVESGWQLYFSFLRRRVSESVFDESFGLSDIYVPLNAYYLLSKERSSRQGEGFDPKPTRVCVRLHDEIKRWLDAGDKSDAIRVISGGPGSGKSSFTKMLCCDFAESGFAKPIYVPLHLIDPTRDVAQEVEKFIRDEGLLGFNPIDPERKENNLLIIFDGLDELASTGKVAAQVARDFVQAVERMVERRNLGLHPIFVILSGRELIVQENETEFRRPKQILSVLPYHIEDDKDSYVDADGLLGVDLRDSWWINYGKLIGRSFKSIPVELKVKEIDEITSQPLLNYLVALSYLRGQLDFSKTLNLNSVYADLVAAVHERAYENSRIFRPISHLKIGEFVRVLEEIGLAAWHGSDGRSTSVREIMIHCQQSGLESLLTSFKEGAQAGVTKLLAAFFFRRSGENIGDDAAFVFTHKSFGEYLSACRIVRGLERIVNERMRRRANADEGFDVNEALLYWLKLAGPAQMTEYLKTFVSRELMRRADVKLEDWQSVLQELMVIAIAGSMPVDRVEPMSFSLASRYEINASTTLLISLNACASIIGNVSSIPFYSETSFGTFLRRVCPQRSGPQSPVLYSSLSYLDYSGQCLDMADFYGANLRSTKWNNCKAHFANFCHASFNSAELSECRFSWARFESSEFNDVKIVNSDLGHAVFDNVRFQDMSFAQVDFRAVDFSDASFTNCNFADSCFAYSSLDTCREMQGSVFVNAEISVDDIKLSKWLAKADARGDAKVDVKMKKQGELQLARRPLGRRVTRARIRS
jgi:uncharacterized protein YjbI with pentapeptide repeats